MTGGVFLLPQNIRREPFIFSQSFLSSPLLRFSAICQEQAPLFSLCSFFLNLLSFLFFPLPQCGPDPVRGGCKASSFEPSPLRREGCRSLHCVTPPPSFLASFSFFPFSSSCLPISDFFLSLPGWDFSAMGFAIEPRRSPHLPAPPFPVTFSIHFVFLFSSSLSSLQRAIRASSASDVDSELVACRYVHLSFPKWTSFFPPPARFFWRDLFSLPKSRDIDEPAIKVILYTPDPSAPFSSPVSSSPVFQAFLSFPPGRTDSTFSPREYGKPRFHYISFGFDPLR